MARSNVSLTDDPVGNRELVAGLTGNAADDASRRPQEPDRPEDIIAGASRKLVNWPRWKVGRRCKPEVKRQRIRRCNGRWRLDTHRRLVRRCKVQVKSKVHRRPGQGRESRCKPAGSKLDVPESITTGASRKRATGRAEGSRFRESRGESGEQNRRRRQSAQAGG